jgi:excisionase family DNA binding protein
MPAVLDGLTTSEVARQVGISEQLVRVLARRGDLPATHTKLGRLFARADIERLAQERAAKQAARL